MPKRRAHWGAVAADLSPQHLLHRGEGEPGVAAGMVGVRPVDLRAVEVAQARTVDAPTVDMASLAAPVRHHTGPATNLAGELAPCNTLLFASGTRACYAWDDALSFRRPRTRWGNAGRVGRADTSAPKSMNSAKPASPSNSLNTWRYGVTALHQKVAPISPASIHEHGCPQRPPPSWRTLCIRRSKRDAHSLL